MGEGDEEGTGGKSKKIKEDSGRGELRGLMNGEDGERERREGC